MGPAGLLLKTFYTLTVGFTFLIIPISDSEFSAECRKLADALDINAIKLSKDDEVKVYPTSVLQAGMLSQVGWCHLAREV